MVANSLPKNNSSKAAAMRNCSFTAGLGCILPLHQYGFRCNLSNGTGPICKQCGAEAIKTSATRVTERFHTTEASDLSLADPGPVMRKSEMTARTKHAT